MMIVRVLELLPVIGPEKSRDREIERKDRCGVPEIRIFSLDREAEVPVKEHKLHLELYVYFGPSLERHAVWKLVTFGSFAVKLIIVM